jgi:hypothetical protein
MFKPNEREMMKYSPPPSTLLLVAISEMANDVGIVTRCPKIIIRITPQKPSVPIAYPKRRNKIAPSIVEIAVKNTGAVPNFLLLSFPIPCLFLIFRMQFRKKRNNSLCEPHISILHISRRNCGCAVMNKIYPQPLHFIKFNE